MSKLSTGAKQELLQAVTARYRSSPAEAKGQILDEFVAVTGFHRKHALRLFNRRTQMGPRRKRGRSRLYDEAVHQALTVLWEASDRVCGKRLKPLLAVLVPALERHGHLTLDAAVRERVFAISAATIDRILYPMRESASCHRRRPKAIPAIRRSIPVRTFADWKDPVPGFLEADLVAHGGESMAGSFAHTLVLTDIASGWTECVPLIVREANLIVDALKQLRTCLPFPMRGIDTDNGTEFVNDPLCQFCKENSIELTRSRPYHKNDQAWVEQKNGSVVRRLVGYGRLEGLAAGEALSRLYSSSRLFVNFFQPSFKLAEKQRLGACVSKRYQTPETPCARLLASSEITDSTKERLRAVLATLDPLRLLDEIRTVQHHVAGLAAGEPVHVLPHRDADLDWFLKSLATAWRDGEVRPTHCAGPKPSRYWRTRKDPFEAVWPRVVNWLESEPDRTAKELFQRLRDENTGVFAQGQLRTLQRRVKHWRQLAARRLVFSQPVWPMRDSKEESGDDRSSPSSNE